MTTTTKTNASRNFDLELCELAETKLEGLESYSPFCLKVHRTLRVAGLTYTRRHGRHPGVFKSLNPTGQVPILLVDGEPVCDSTAIVRRIEALAPDRLHAGFDEETLGRARLWEELADTSLNGFLVAARWADDRNWPAVRDCYFGDAPRLVCAVITPRLRNGVVKNLIARDVWRAGPDACWARFEMLLDQLDTQAPKEGFWVAPQISVADIAIFAQLHSLRTSLTPWQREQVEARSRLTAYLDRVDAATRAPAARRPLSARHAQLVALLSA